MALISGIAQENPNEGRVFPDCLSNPTEKHWVATKKTQFLAEMNLKFCTVGEATDYI